MVDVHGAVAPRLPEAPTLPFGRACMCCDVRLVRRIPPFQFERIPQNIDCMGGCSMLCWRHSILLAPWHSIAGRSRSSSSLRALRTRRKSFLCFMLLVHTLIATLPESWSSSSRAQCLAQWIARLGDHRSGRTDPDGGVGRSLTRRPTQTNGATVRFWAGVTGLFGGPPGASVCRG